MRCAPLSAQRRVTGPLTGPHWAGGRESGNLCTSWAGPCGGLGRSIRTCGYASEPHPSLRRGVDARTRSIRRPSGAVTCRQCSMGQELGRPRCSMQPSCAFCGALRVSSLRPRIFRRATESCRCAPSNNGGSRVRVDPAPACDPSYRLDRFTLPTVTALPGIGRTMACHYHALHARHALSPPVL